MGGTDYRKEFSKWWKETFKAIKFPHRGEVWGYYVDPTTSHPHPHPHPHPHTLTLTLTPNP